MERPSLLAVAVTAAGTLVVAACGSLAAPTASGAGGTSPAASSSPQAGAQAAPVGSCTLSAVKVSLDSANDGVAAGSAYVPLEFENVSASPCSLPSYPTVTLAAGAGGPDIGTPAAQQDATAVQAVVLAPGQLAHAWLQIINAANYPAAACQPVSAGGLLVGLGSAPPSFIADSVPACAHQPVTSPMLSVFPLRAGQAQRGTIP